MRRAAFLVLLVPLLSILLMQDARADNPIGPTPVQMIAVDVYEKQAVWGTTATFEFGLFNGDNSTGYVINATVSSDRADFSSTVFPANFTLQPSAFRRLSVNVTPIGGVGEARGTVTLRVIVGSPAIGEAAFAAVLDAKPKTAMLDVTTSFIAIGFIILIGFTAAWIFDRTGVPDTIFLIFLGLLLGPIVAKYLGIVLVSQQALSTITPYLATLALVMILFDGGLNLNLEAMLKRLGISALHTIVTFLLSVATVVLVTCFVLGYPLVVGLLLGAIIGGTSGAVVITLVRKMHLHEDSKMILVMESVMTDVACVIVAIAVMEFIRAGPGASATSILPKLAAGFSIAIVIALVLGVLWLRALTRLSGKPFAYMVTLAMLLVLYAVVEMVGGSGVMAALVFGLVLGNHEEIARMFKVKSGFVLDDKIKHFQMELAFLLRTFFFVLLGLVFALDINGYWAVNTSIPVLSEFNGKFILVAVGVTLIFLGFVAVRRATSAMTCSVHKESRGDSGSIWAMMDRGLTAAVLASVPFAVVSFTNPADPSYSYYRGVLGPYQAQFLNITFLIILLTSLATTVGIAVRERRIRKARSLTSEEVRKKERKETVKSLKAREAERYRERLRKQKEVRRQAERLRRSR